MFFCERCIVKRTPYLLVLHIQKDHFIVQSLSILNLIDAVYVNLLKLFETVPLPYFLQLLLEDSKPRM